MRITVKTKLGLAFGTIIVLSGVTAWLGITSLASLNSAMAALMAGPVERIEMASGLKVDLLLAVRAEKDLLLAGSDAPARSGFDAELVKQRDALGPISTALRRSSRRRVKSGWRCCEARGRSGWR